MHFYCATASALTAPVLTTGGAWNALLGRAPRAPPCMPPRSTFGACMTPMTAVGAGRRRSARAGTDAPADDGHADDASYST